jgi:hypothetical protein
MPKRTDPNPRLFTLALIGNAMSWSQMHEPGWWVVAGPSYALGFVVGWVVHPFFIPKRDQWTKSGYDRLSVRILRSLMVAGMLSFISYTAWKVLSK